MKYYVVADVHGFFTELQTALNEKGFFEDKEPHKLIVCGDLFDRGNEAVKVQDFILDLLRKDEVILIMGNHEDLFEDFIDNISLRLTPNVMRTAHWTNGTVETVLQLTDMMLMAAVYQPNRCAAMTKETPFYTEILPKMQNYYETKNYVFVHGWIPCVVFGRGTQPTDIFAYDKEWRTANSDRWEQARWLNGMLAASKGVREPDKTIVCGHWNCSYGHAVLDGKGTEFDDDADNTPYYGDGIIAMDANTARSGRVNCIVLEDEE